MGQGSVRLPSCARVLVMIVRVLIGMVLINFGAKTVLVASGCERGTGWVARVCKSNAQRVRLALHYSVPRGVRASVKSTIEICRQTHQ